MTLQSDQIAEHIAQHESKAANSMDPSERLAAALKLVRSEDRFDKWKAQQLAELDRQEEEIRRARDLQLRRREWFKHFNGVLDDTVEAEVSNLPPEIFADCAEQPRNWDEAAFALFKLPEFQVKEAEKLSQVIEACADAVEVSDRLLEALSSYRKAIKSAKDDPSKWNRERTEYHDRRIELVADFNEKMRAAYDC